VLEMKVLTDYGKRIIRDYEKSFDAQAVYKTLKDYHLKSTKAKIESSTLLTYITRARIGDGVWQGTTEGFIINWQNQVRLCEQHVLPGDIFSDNQNLVMLQNAVHKNDELCQVKNTADLLYAKSNDNLTYEEYASLLLSSATAYDAQYKPTKVKRQDFNHTTSDDYEYDNDDTEFNIYSPTSYLQANSTNFQSKGRQPFHGNRVRMSSEKWFALDAEDKALWDQLDDKAKSIILGYPSISYPLRGFKGRPTIPKPSFKTQAHLHEISAYEYLSNMHHTEDPLNEDPGVDDPEPVEILEEEESDTRLINSATSYHKLPYLLGDV
jgi:hypothetical protein